MHGVADTKLQSSAGSEARDPHGRWATGGEGKSETSVGRKRRRRRSKPLPRGPFDRRTRLGRRRDALVAMFTAPAQLFGEVPPALAVKIAAAAELVALAEQYRASFMRGAAMVPLDDLVRLERLAAGAVRGLHLDRHQPQQTGPSLADILAEPP